MVIIIFIILVIIIVIIMNNSWYLLCLGSGVFASVTCHGLAVGEAFVQQCMLFSRL